MLGTADDNTHISFEERLRATAKEITACQRPALVHINADTTWLLQLPYKGDPQFANGRSHFNILIDPWLRGRQSDVASWFSSQWHAVESSVQTIGELNQLLRNTQDCRFGSIDEKINLIDAILVSHEFTDHCHKGTLLEVDQTVPVFATAKAATLIRSWKHFKTVLEPTYFSIKQSDWQATSAPPLPDWIGISRIVTETDSLYYHSAVMINFSLNDFHVGTSKAEDAAEAVIYAPHGIHADDLMCLEVADPPVKTLALMHGLHDVKLSRRQLNLGAHNGLRAQRICRAKYWVSTHDEVKKARGFIAPFLCRKVLTLKDALEEEERFNDGVNTSELPAIEYVNFAELQNGEIRILI